MSSATITAYYPGGSSSTQLPESPLHLAFGIFDGVHRGHAVVLNSAQKAQKVRGGVVGVLTFDPHPSRVLRPDDATQLILPLAEKLRALFRMGMEVVIVKQFTEVFSRLSADDFLMQLKQEIPQLVSLHVGENFRYGSNRSGDAEQLISDGSRLGIEVNAIARQEFEREIISSSRIREFLREGEIEKANKCLGWTYSTLGQVVKGKQLGRTIGIPTLNIAWSPETAPRYGVYAVRVYQLNRNLKPVYPEKIGNAGVANYGLRPTVESSKVPMLEVHLFQGGDQVNYGDYVKVEWLNFIREERSFLGVESLKKQICKDIDQVKKQIERD